jgi:hypothetical protein
VARRPALRHRLRGGFVRGRPEQIGPHLLKPASRQGVPHAVHCTWLPLAPGGGMCRPRSWTFVCGGGVMTHREIVLAGRPGAVAVWVQGCPLRQVVREAGALGSPGRSGGGCAAARGGQRRGVRLGRGGRGRAGGGRRATRPPPAPASVARHAGAGSRGRLPRVAAGPRRRAAVGPIAGADAPPTSTREGSSVGDNGSSPAPSTTLPRGRSNS